MKFLRFLAAILCPEPLVFLRGWFGSGMAGGLLFILIARQLAFQLLPSTEMQAVILHYATVIGALHLICTFSGAGRLWASFVPPEFTGRRLMSLGGRLSDTVAGVLELVVAAVVFIPMGMAMTPPVPFVAIWHSLGIGPRNQWSGHAIMPEAWWQPSLLATESAALMAFSVVVGMALYLLAESLEGVRIFAQPRPRTLPWPVAALPRKRKAPASPSVEALMVQCL